MSLAVETFKSIMLVSEKGLCAMAQHSEKKSERISDPGEIRSSVSFYLRTHYSSHEAAHVIMAWIHPKTHNLFHVPPLNIEKSDQVIK